MAQGLSVSDVVSVGIILSPTAAVGRNFGTLLVIGSSPVIDVSERVRSYAALGGVAEDFGTLAPEYLAAVEFFAQTPQPTLLKIGRFAQVATNGVLHGAPPNPYVLATNLAALQAVTAGNLDVTIDGTAKVLTGLNFTTAANLNGVAAVIAAALGAAGSCLWDGVRLTITSASSGPSSTVSYANTPSGTDIATLLGLTAAAGASVPVAGQAAETPLAALVALTGLNGDFYAVTFAPLVPLSDPVLLQVSAMVEALAPVRVHGVTLSEPPTLDPTVITDLASLMKASGYSRTVMQYSSTNPFAICSFFGRALGVNFTGDKTTLTMKFKQEPGVIAEMLSETQAATLGAKNVNVFVQFQNSTSIIQQGVVASGRFWDEVHGLDWLANEVQTDLFNLLYQSQTKIPQTDDGVHVLYTQFEASLSQAVVNGLIAPGTWNAEGFGQLKRGDPLPKGFYVYAPLVALQSQADREARKAPIMQAAIKMAGAIHFVDTLISVNR